MKKCKKCNIEQSLENFHKCKLCKDEITSICKSCVKIEKKLYDKKYYVLNQEKKLANTKKFYNNNKEKHSKYYKNYNIINKKKSFRTKKIYNKANIEKKNQYFIDICSYYNRFIKKTRYDV